MRTDFSLRDIEIFHAIATAGSTRQAAVQLGITQSAVSHALARLEDSLHIRLFARENQRLQFHRPAATCSRKPCSCSTG
ncbi:helix-turn-helix domain-containing protein [Burkholderia cenocepacia]